MSSAFVPGLIAVAACSRNMLRELPIAGECLVKVGQKVSSEEVIARAQIPGDLLVVRIPEKLSIDVAQVRAALKVKVGQTVAQGENLCTHTGLFGFFSSSCKAPVAGEVEFFSEQTGHIGLRCTPRLLELKAHINGLVTAVNNGKSVNISAECAFVQGIFGIGGERRGRLIVLDDLRRLWLKEHLPSGDLTGSVLVVRGAPSTDFVLAAAQAGANGLIVGSIDDQALSNYLGYDIGIALTGNEDIPMTVIVTEGFGELLMSERIFNLLKNLDGQSASINGTTKVRAGAERPEIIVTNTTNAAKNNQTYKQDLQLGLELGSKVRIIRVPYFGLEGSVKDLPNALTKIETGVLTRVVNVELVDRRVVTVARANVELVG